jgi:hypothetical protein
MSRPQGYLEQPGAELVFIVPRTMVRGRAGPGTTAGRAPGGYEQSPLSSFGGLDAECSLPTSRVAARPAPNRASRCRFGPFSTPTQVLKVGSASFLAIFDATPREFFRGRTDFGRFQSRGKRRAAYREALVPQDGISSCHRPGFPGKTWPVPSKNRGPGRKTGLFLPDNSVSVSGKRSPGTKTTSGVPGR